MYLHYLSFFWGKVGKYTSPMAAMGLENLANIHISINDQEKPIPNDQTTNQAIFEALKPLTLKKRMAPTIPTEPLPQKPRNQQKRTEVLSYHSMLMYSKHC